MWWVPPLCALVALVISLAVEAVRPDRFATEARIAVRVEDPAGRAEQDKAAVEAQRVSLMLLSAARSDDDVEAASATSNGAVATLEVVAGSADTAREAAARAARQAISEAEESVRGMLEETRARIDPLLAQARAAADESNTALLAFYREHGVAPELATAQAQALGAAFTAVDAARASGGDGDRAKRVAAERFGELQRLTELENAEAPLRRASRRARDTVQGFEDRLDEIERELARLETEPPYTLFEPPTPERLDGGVGPLALIAIAIAGGAVGLLVVLVADWLAGRRRAVAAGLE